MRTRLCLLPSPDTLPILYNPCMLLVSFKKAVKKIPQSNKKGSNGVATTLQNAADNQDTSEVYTIVSVENNRDIKHAILQINIGL